MITYFKILIPSLALICILTPSCKSPVAVKEEQIRTEEESDTSTVADSLVNSISGNVSFNQIPSALNQVVITGIPDYKLVPVYKARKTTSKSEMHYSSDRWDEGSDEIYEHYMPGIDVLFGYNLLNISHYDMKTGVSHFIFKKPVLIKTVYFPSFEADSIHKMPVNRNYFIISVYDEDTNKDTLLNKKDLRRIYHFDEHCSTKTQLVPPDYSVIRSQYDSKNDAMYIFAKLDANKNGSAEREEPMHVFWIDLKQPEPAKRLY